MRVLILAGDTDSNLGDLAIATAIIATLQELYDNAKIELVTGHPDRDCERLGITPIARGLRGLPGLIRAARQADIVICGGGGLFQDDDSLVKMPYWATRLAMVRMISPRIIGCSIGAGPLTHDVSRFCAAIALRQLERITVRDEYAREILTPLTRHAIDVIPDPAFMLPAAPREQAEKFLHTHGASMGGRPLIGVSVKRSFHARSNLIPHKYAVKYGLRKIPGKELMRTNVALTAAALDEVATKHGAGILFMPTYTAAHENDTEICQAVSRHMKTRHHSIIEIDDPCLYKAVCRKLRVMLSGRMHAAILAAGAGTPAVGLAYNQKFSGVFDLLGQSSRCLQLDQFVENGDWHVLADKLSEAMTASPAEKPDTGKLAQTTRNFLQALGRN